MIAQGALILWPLVALVLYATMPAGRATIWTLLAGYLLLPVGYNFDFPGVPPLDKTSIPNAVALILAPMRARGGEFRWPRSRIINGLMLVWVLAPFATAFTNREVIVIGSVVMPSLGFREGLSGAVGNILALAPFVLGAALLANEKGHRQILMALVIGALAYSAPILLEIRVSPFLQGMVYGISDPGFFLQQMRFGGFRSMMFLGHGLLVSAFLSMALVAAIGLWRMRVKLFGIPMSMIALYLAVVLVMNKSVGAVLLVILIAPLFMYLSSRRFLAFAAALAMIIVAYPAVRGASLFPLNQLVAAANAISPDRAESLDFRFRNEEILLKRAKEKPLFGWGTYGRNRVIVVTNWGGTSDISVTDGIWVIMIGTAGWLGYVVNFGLLTLPFRRAFQLRRTGLPLATVTLVALHLVNVIDLIPNSSLTPMTWLIAGALANMSVARRKNVSPAEAEGPAEPLMPPATAARQAATPPTAPFDAKPARA